MGWIRKTTLQEGVLAATYKQMKERQKKFIDYGWNYLSGNPLQNLQDAEDEMPVGNLLEHIGTEPLPECHHQLMMTGGAEVAELAGKGQQRDVWDKRVKSVTLQWSGLHGLS